ncbi:MAG: hypothetical protein ACI4Q3_02045 [Kiritimatiellia bacterium]
MIIYLYTENFETKRFDLFKFVSGRLDIIDDEEEYSRGMSMMLDLECIEEVDKDGVAAVGGVYGRLKKTYVSFKVLINELAPSGRGRLIFGSTEPSLCFHYPWSNKQVPREVKEAIEQLMQRNNVTVPCERLENLEQCVTIAKKQCWKKLVMWQSLG